MSGCASACAGAGVPTPVTPFAATMDWTGAVPVHVNSASGSTGGSNVFVHTETGGVAPYATPTLTITSNPSGKLGITTVGAYVGVSWSGLAVGETATINVRFTSTDAAGTTKSATDGTAITRDS